MSATEWYGRLPREYIKSGALNDLVGAPLHVYIQIAAHAGEGFKARPCVDTLVASTGLSKRTVQRAIGKFVALGHMTADRRGGKGKSSQYTLTTKCDTKGDAVSESKGDRQDVAVTADKGDAQGDAVSESKGDRQNGAVTADKGDAQGDAVSESKGDRQDVAVTADKGDKRVPNGDITVRKGDNQGGTRKGKEKNTTCSSSLKMALSDAGIRDPALARLSQRSDLTVHDVSSVRKRAEAKNPANLPGLLVHMLEAGERETDQERGARQKRASHDAKVAEALQSLDALPRPNAEESRAIEDWVKQVGNSQVISYTRDVCPYLFVNGEWVVTPYTDERVILACYQCAEQERDARSH